MSELHFIHAASSVHVDGTLADVLVLTDGRVIVIDGETLTIFEDLDSLLDPEEDDEDEHDRPSLPLMITE